MTTKAPVVFVHGLWLHATGWGNWLDMFRSAGYDSIAPGYPGDGATVQETLRSGATGGPGHRRPDRRLHERDRRAAGQADRHRALPRRTDRPEAACPGNRRGRGRDQSRPDQGRAADTARPAPVGTGGAGRPGNRRRAISLNARQFRFGFGNALPAAESQDLFDRWTIPGPGRPAFEVATSNFHRTSPAAVDTRLDDRGPLLFIAGGADHIVPPAVARAASGLYAASRATTDYHEFPGRGHSMVLDHGWRDVAEYSLSWLERQGF